MSYYIAKVKIATDTSKGVKYVSEQYLVNATSVTHAEALVNKDFVDTGIDFDQDRIDLETNCLTRLRINNDGATVHNGNIFDRNNKSSF